MIGFRRWTVSLPVVVFEHNLSKRSPSVASLALASSTMSAILQHTVPWLRARPLLSLVILLAPIVLLLHLRRARRQHKRRRTVLPSAERVLVIGASSGVGRALALQYASRGALVCAVARRKDKVEAVAAECGAKALGVVADFTNPEDMVNVRETLRKGGCGIYTLTRFVNCTQQTYLYRMGRRGHSPGVRRRFLITAGNEPHRCASRLRRRANARRHPGSHAHCYPGTTRKHHRPSGSRSHICMSSSFLP